jgi:hypothetical protein
MAAGDGGNGRTSLSVWDVPPDQEEPWCFLQELSGSRRRPDTGGDVC